MNGLFLQGGGAKGAFQAGAIYALKEKGIKFDIICGTSIGAVNGYFLYKSRLEEMKKMYTEIDMKTVQNQLTVNKVIENQFIIENLGKLKGNDENIKHFYVNYVSVNKGELEEKLVDITKIQNDEKLKSVKYSSLLPFALNVNENFSFQNMLRDYNTQNLFEAFRGKLIDGEYDGYNLDGGILNNNLMQPFVDHKVDKIYLLPLHNGFTIPQYLLDVYDKENIIVIKREEEFIPQDTIRFEPEFCRRLFDEGRRKGKRTVES
ncbi:patatin-like phospholipase family protein [Haloimpatiens sp. FM7330]|uniref:patatin-like phospholipase family protein n=1 Tax=Haloimpatiens sp. FM7330 TaxID=3298610 RepID=UPI00363F5061